MVNGIDITVVAVYLALTLVVGLWAGRGGSSAEGFLLGRRSLPWWALLLSIVATETSTVTFLSLPGKTFSPEGNFFFLQLALGYMFGRLVVVSVLLPLFFSGKFFTAYEVLQQQYGPGVRLACSLLFLITRTLADGLRLYLTCLVIQAATGADFTLCVLGITLFTTIYAAVGGVGSVVANDCLQFIAYTAGALVALALMLGAVPEGWQGMWTFAAETGRDRWINLSGSLTTSEITLWSGLFGGALLSMASHGADHMMVQRYLAARSQRQAGLALGLSGPLVALQFLLFLVIGLALAYFYASTPVDYTIEAGDRAFIGYIVNELGTGLRGFVMAAVVAAAMSTMSSSLNAAAGVVTKDFVGLLRPNRETPRETDSDVEANDKRTVTTARIATVLFAGLQAGVAVAAFEYVRQHPETAVIDSVLAIAGFVTGLVLGLYALGLLLSACGDAIGDAIGLAALAVGFAVASYVAFGTDLSWPWFTLVGSTTTFAVGLLLSKFMRPAPTS